VIRRFTSASQTYEVHCVVQFESPSKLSVAKEEVKDRLEFLEGIHFSVAAQELLRPLVYPVESGELCRRVYLGDEDFLSLSLRLPPHPGVAEGRRGIVSLVIDRTIGALCVELRYRRPLHWPEEIKDCDLTSVCQEFIVRIASKHGTVIKTGFGYMNSARGVLVKFSISDLSAFDVALEPRSKEITEEEEEEDGPRPFVWIDAWLPPPTQTGWVPRSFSHCEGEWMREIMRCLIPVFLKLTEVCMNYFLTAVLPVF
jgi:hypothetical protein